MHCMYSANWTTKWHTQSYEFSWLVKRSCTFETTSKTILLNICNVWRFKKKVFHVTADVSFHYHVWTCYLNCWWKTYIMHLNVIGFEYAIKMAGKKRSQLVYQFFALLIAKSSICPLSFWEKKIIELVNFVRMSSRPTIALAFLR